MKIKSKSLVLSVVLWIGLVAPSYAAKKVADPKVIHVLNRLSLGSRPGDVERVEAMGVERYIKQQLSPELIAEPHSLTDKLSKLKTLSMTPMELAREYGLPKSKPGKKPSNRDFKVAAEQARRVKQEAIAARLLRATASNRQLQEVMVDFWFNHFNVFGEKGKSRLWVGAYEQQAIRPHVLGNFRDLLGATAHHPAMLAYLNNSQNKTSDRSARLNENYARELMELHTLGVDGGYTQQDVIALAKLLTGWGYSNDLNQPGDHPYGFYFNPKWHDFSDKVFLGYQIKGKGKAEGDQALDILARSPATAQHISYKLAQYFVSDQPPRALVNRLAKRYLATDGNIQAVLDTLFHSSEFSEPKNYQAKFKTPYQYLISAIRATEIEVHDLQSISHQLRQWGMPLYGCPTPDGYKNTQQAWLNPDAMLRRISFATTLARGQLPLVNAQGMLVSNQTLSKPVDPVKLGETLGNRFSDQTQKAIASNPPNLRAALILGSPEFMRR